MWVCRCFSLRISVNRLYYSKSYMSECFNKKTKNIRDVNHRNSSFSFELFILSSEFAWSHSDFRFENSAEIALLCKTDFFCNFRYWQISLS